MEDFPWVKGRKKEKNGGYIGTRKRVLVTGEYGKR